MKYPIIIEETDTGYSSYSPDLPGCDSTGSSRVEAEKHRREAIQFHIEGMKINGLNVPKPASSSI